MSIFDGREPNKTLIQTYVFFSKENAEDRAFFVSTIDRDSSSMYGGRYAETIVWDWNSTTKERGDIIHMEEALQGSIRKHNLVCEELYKHGCILKDEEE